MQNREAAKYVTDTLMEVTNKVMTSIEHINSLKEVEKVTPQEAEAYRENMMGPLLEMLPSVLNPVFEIHPDLRPPCRSCDVSKEPGSECE